MRRVVEVGIHVIICGCARLGVLLRIEVAERRGDALLFFGWGDEDVR